MRVELRAELRGELRAAAAAYHWMRPPPTSTDTKYLRRPRYTL